MVNLRLKSPSARLFVLSFLILFFELVCIRWLSSYVLYLGYFTNLVLLGALLGIGAGTLISHKFYRLFSKAPLAMFLFFTVVLFTRAQLDPSYENIIFFTTSETSIRLPAYVLLPLIFIGVTAIFTFLSHDLGHLLTQFAPLRAYNLNILGSLAGIAGFTAMSYFSLPSWVWFLVAVLFLIALLPAEGSFGPNVLLALGLVAVIASSDYAFANIWSPYYRLNMLSVEGEAAERVRLDAPSSPADRYVLHANGVAHQALTSFEESEPFYSLPYTVFDEKPAYRNALVIGSGGGNDVAFALANGVAQIDAVEIDRHIIELGRRYHPESPYSDPRVNVYNDDARSFLKKADRQYDLIVFALPDSLVLATNSSNLRLESYLFTEESFRSVADHLAPDGLFVLYNYYRYDWLVDKIGSMAERVFGEQPLYHRMADPNYAYFAFATIFAGPKANEINPGQAGFFELPEASFSSATDDWPFLYLREPALPGLYTVTLGFILLASFVFIQRLAPRGAIRQHGLPFFFMGAAFTLLEVKSIVQFLLLFGSTWIVNSLVFFGILLVVLLANALAARYRFTRMWLLYLLLFLALLLNYMVPLKSLLVNNLVLQYILATAFLFSPIFFANLIYSTTFRDTQQADISFGANLLGTMVGGTVEYLSLYFGYQNLVIVAGAFYLLAFVFFYQLYQQHRLSLAPGD